VFRASLILTLAACGDNIDEHGQSHDLTDLLTEWITEPGAVRGTVYRCESGAMCLSTEGEPTTEEWCYLDDAEGDLEALLAKRAGATDVDCWPIGVSERWWPAVVGCAYSCDLMGPGSNAHCGMAGCS
jgi:hypothetical protein